MRTILAVMLAGSAAAFAADPLPAPAIDTELAPAQDLDQVLSCMRANVPAAIKVSKFEVTSVSAGGEERKLAGSLHAAIGPHSLKARLMMESPPDLAGIAYLVNESAKAHEIHVHLPAVNRTRRVLGADLNSPLFGTDLSYNELRQLVQAFNLAWLDFPGTADGRKFERLNVFPQAGMAGGYKQVRLQVDQKTCVPYRAELADASGTRKIFVTDAQRLQQAGSSWLIREAEVLDPVKGTRTRFRLSEVATPARLPDGLFSPTSFYLTGR